MNITTLLRQHQEADPTLGPLFLSLHKFADRTIEEFYWDTPEMPHPVVAMEKDRPGRLGYYTTKDGYTLIHRINLNPYALRTGDDAAETLAHEMVHLWQAHVGRPIKRNYHGAEFHARMATYGIQTAGKRGTHTGYTDGRWQAWMEENADLNLHRFELPGPDTSNRRPLVKWRCPACNTKFRSRTDVAALCMPCGKVFEEYK